MVRCDRFVIKYDFDEYKYSTGDVIATYNTYPIIYDRVNEKKVVAINTGNEKLDEELVEAVLTMLNIKFIGKPEKTT